MLYKINEDSRSSGKSGFYRSVPLTCVLIVIHFLLIRFAPSLPGQEILFFVFFITTIMLPGFLAASILFPDSRFYLKLFLSVTFGVSLFFALLFLFSLTYLDIFYISILIPFLSLAMAIYSDYGGFRGYDPLNNQPLSKTVLVIMVLIAAGVSIITLGIGDPVIYTADSPDHMTYIRAVTNTRQVFPDQFLYKDGGMLTKDIRKGLLHSMWGAINLLTGKADVFPVWPLLSWIGSLFLLLGIFCLGVQLFGRQSIGILGVILYILFYRYGLTGHHLVTTAFGFNFGKIFLFGFIAFLPPLFRSFRKELLLLVALFSFAATGTHISYIMLSFFVIFIFCVMQLTMDKKKDIVRLIRKTGPLLFGIVAAVNLPYLLLRYFRHYNPANEIHTHVQGMLFLTDKLAIINPLLFLQSDGPMILVAFFSIFILWRKSREDRSLRFLLGLTAGVYLLMFNPLWVKPIMDRITYLIVRFSATAPTMLVTAYLLHILCLKLLRRSRLPSRWGTVIGLIVLVASLSPKFIKNFTEFAYAGEGRRYRENKSCLNLKDVYAEINDEIPRGSVILSDPITSYCLPAFTDQFVVCTYDQHSTPNDSTALDRIIACRDVYTPSASCGDIAETLEEYRAEYIIINGRVPTSVISQYWRPRGKSARMTAEKLLKCEDGFQPVYSKESAYIFKYNGAENLSGKSFK